MNYNSSATINATPSIAAVVYDVERPPVDKKKQKKKRKKTKKKHQRKHRKPAPKKEQHDRAWVSWLLGGLSVITAAAAIAWGIYFLPILFGGGLSFGCGPIASILAAIVLGFLGSLLFLFFALGTIALIVLAIYLAKRFKEKDGRLKSITNKDRDELEERFLGEAQDEYPNWPLEAMGRYTDMKINLIELKAALEDLQEGASQQSGRVAEKTNEDIESLKIAIAKKEAFVDEMKTAHDELSDIPKENHWEYIKLSSKIEALKTEQAIYKVKNTAGQYDRKLEQLESSIIKNKLALGAILRN